MRRIHIYLFAILFSLVSFSSVAYALTGTIDASNYLSRVCTNSDCTTYNRINWKPTYCQLHPNEVTCTDWHVVKVNDVGLLGDIWSETWGWIRLNPNSPAPSIPACTSTGVKMVPQGSGILSGCAWGENIGWINFKPTNGGVTVSSSTGEFLGWAWGENIGWIRFNCASAEACVKTDWQPTDGTSAATAGTVAPPPPPPTSTTTDGSTSVTPPPPTTDTTTSTDGGDGTPGSSDPTGPTNTTTTTDGGDGTPGSSDTTSTDGGDGTPGSSDTTSTDGGDGTPDAAVASDATTGTDVTTGPGSSSGGTITHVPEEEGGGTSSWPTLPDIFNTLGQIKPPSATEPIARAVALIGAATGVAMTLASFFSINPFSIADLTSLPLRLWTLLLSALGLRKKPWGVVYDAVTKQPLDPVYVILKDMAGNDVGTSITDLDGRYGFLAKVGQYTISAGKTNYVFPSEKLKGMKFDELYQDLYFGEPITVSSKGEVLAKNIPMDPIKFDWNEFAKRDRKLMSFYTEHSKSIAYVSRVLFYVGFAVSLVAVIANAQLFNILIFSLYVLIFILRRFGLKQKPYGGVVEQTTGYVIPFAIVRIYSPTTNVEIVHKITDATGRYYCLVANGTYYATVEVKNPDGSYTKKFTTQPFNVTKGYIDKLFEIF